MVRINCGMSDFGGAGGVGCFVVYNSKHPVQTWTWVGVSLWRVFRPHVCYYLGYSIIIILN